MRLTKELGRGYGTSNLKDMRQVYIKFSNRRTLFSELSWNHYVLLSRLSSSREIDDSKVNTNTSFLNKTYNIWLLTPFVTNGSADTSSLATKVIYDNNIINFYSGKANSNGGVRPVLYLS